MLLVLWFRRAEFDGVVDGIVFAGLAGVGFAFTENILYFGEAFLAGGEELGVTGGFFAAGVTFVLRGVLSPFAHPLFSAMFGIGLGLAARSPRGATRWGRRSPASCWRCSCTRRGTGRRCRGCRGFFTGYVVIMVPAFALTVGVAAWSRRREGATVARHLPTYVEAGWLAPDDVPMLASLPRRRQAVRWVERRHGTAVSRALRDFQHTATELAFLRERLARGHPVAGLPPPRAGAARRPGPVARGGPRGLRSAVGVDRAPGPGLALQVGVQVDEVVGRERRAARVALGVLDHRLGEGQRVTPADISASTPAASRRTVTVEEQPRQVKSTSAVEPSSSTRTTSRRAGRETSALQLGHVSVNTAASSGVQTTTLSASCLAIHLRGTCTRRRDSGRRQPPGAERDRGERGVDDARHPVDHPHPQARQHASQAAARERPLGVDQPWRAR